MWEELAVIANFLLVAVGIAGVIVAVTTLRKVERQTKAGEDAAKAALLQAEHTVTAERAWLIIRSSMEGFVLEAGDTLEFWWAITNSGNTPARILETQCAYEHVDSADLTSLPAVPKYPQPIVLEGAFLAPGDTSDYLTSLVDMNGHPEPPLDATDVDVILMGMFYLRAYGFVKYLDAFGVQHESRFCEYFVVPQKRRPRATGFRPLIGVPAEYTRCT